ncbi:c-type cytochrome biogenesis protein CcmI [Vibrio olivae]|uniref:C-type cytochrome biogenesis protein CcmI n=1 Tax=Vibrio olivae TaxID=1243002 RepID=A0ABV5HKV8_9VIBR
MMYFWVASLVLIVICAVFIFLPALKRRENNDQVLRDELNKAFYKDRLSELKEESNEGLVEDQQDLINDLKQSLLDDIPSDKLQQRQQALSPWLILVPSVLLMGVLSYALYAHFGAAQQVKAWQDVTNNLPELSKKLMQQDGAVLTDQEMQDLTLGLRTRLHYNPEDATGWMLLGRIGLANRDTGTSVGAMKKAYDLKPDDQDIQLGYAQALMLSQDEADQEVARNLLLQLTKQDYVDIRVFSLLAFDAYERQDFTSAIKYWGVMQQMIGPNDQRYEMLTRSIDNAKQQMSGSKANQASVKVTINLGDAVVLDPNAVLIVSVHHANGSPMPVAAARYPVSSFPLTVELDDRNSMLESSKLSDLDSLMVRVRLDSDGNVATKQGDWFGESKVVKIDEPVNITINQQYP